MKKRTKGFTLIEVIITLAITTVVLGAVYTFFITSSKRLATTEVRSEMQGEAEGIQRVLLVIGTDGTGISKVIDETDATLEKYTEAFTETDIENNKRLKVKLLEIALEDGSICTLEYDSATKILSSKIGSGIKEILSRNVQEFSIRPLDIRMKKLSDDPTFANSPGLEFYINLNKKKGYSEVNYPISIITKFRNK